MKGREQKPPPRVYLGKLLGLNATPRNVLEQALTWIDGEALIPSGSRVFLKPNLTWMEPMPGVTTSPAFIETVVAVLRDRTSKIIIGESDGGYHSFKAEEAFAGHRLYGVRDRFSVQVVNLSSGPTESQTLDIAGYPVTVELPSLLLNEVDVFVTLPVPKVHAMTTVSLGFKNQWGCQSGTMRLRNHPEFARKILAINKLVRPRLTLFDGTYFLDKMGPM
ncbi:MAG: DUF362 domain-containing protein, partial [Candidatus Binatia bacterium]